MGSTDVELAPNTVFQPDVVVLLKTSAKKLKERHIVGTSDLAVELISPSSETYDRHRKLAAYARAGVQKYWIVDPDSRTVEVLILENGEYHSQGVFRGKALLPSLIVPDFLIHVELFLIPRGISRRISTPLNRNRRAVVDIQWQENVYVVEQVQHVYGLTSSSEQGGA